MPSALLCPFYPPLCCAPSSCSPPCPAFAMPTTISCVLSSTLRACVHRPSVPNSPCIATLPLLYIHLDFYLPFVLPYTQLCPYSVLILTPDLYLAIRLCYRAVISLPCHLRPILLSSLFRYPPRPALPSTMACPCAPFAVPFLPSDLPYLLPYLRLLPYRRHVLTPVFPFAQSSANPSTMC